MLCFTLILLTLWLTYHNSAVSLQAAYLAALARLKPMHAPTVASAKLASLDSLEPIQRLRSARINRYMDAAKMHLAVAAVALIATMNNITQTT